MTTPRPRRHRRVDGIVHRWRPFPCDHLTTVDGIVTTRAARTLVDLAGAIHPARTERAVDHALAARLTTPTELRAVFEELAGRGRSGIALMRRLLDERDIGYIAPASELEARFLELIRTANLPAPTRQVEVGDDAGWVGRVDAAYPARRLIVELDGRRHHTQLLDLQSDRARDNRLMADGWRVVRLTWDDVTERPGPAVALVRAALSRSGDVQPGQNRVQRHQFAG